MMFELLAKLFGKKSNSCEEPKQTPEKQTASASIVLPREPLKATGDKGNIDFSRKSSLKALVFFSKTGKPLNEFRPFISRFEEGDFHENGTSRGYQLIRIVQRDSIRCQYIDDMLQKSRLPKWMYDHTHYELLREQPEFIDLAEVDRLIPLELLDVYPHPYTEKVYEGGALPLDSGLAWNREGHALKVLKKYNLLEPETFSEKEALDSLYTKKQLSELSSIPLKSSKKKDFYLEQVLAEPNHYGIDLKRSDWPTVYRLKPLDAKGLDLEAIRKQMAWSSEYAWAIYWCYRRFW